MFHLFEDIGASIFVRLQMFVLLSRNVTTHTWDRYCCTFYTESTVLLLLLVLNIQYSIYSYSYPYINLAPIRVTLILGTSTLSTEARFLGETIHYIGIEYLCTPYFNK